MNDLYRISVGLIGTGTTAALEQTAEHPATIAAAATTALYMVVAIFFKIKNGE